MTAASLRSLTCKDLAKLAKKDGVAGWHSMRKEELIRALVNAARRQARASNKTGKPSTNGRKSKKSASGSQVAEKRRNPRVARRIRRFQSSQKLLKLLATSENGGDDVSKDRLVVMVRDAYWLHASWELRRKSVERAAAAMGQHWHYAQPVLRLLAVGRSGAKNSIERVLRDIPIHGGVNNWYIDVTDPPSSFQVEIGYAAGDRFHSLARSNVVTTPAPGDNSELDKNWEEVARQCEKIFAMSGGLDINGSAAELRELFEERLRRPMGSPLVTRYGVGADGALAKRDDFTFEVDSELLVYGTTSPDSHVSFRGEPIELREDGTFTVRVSLPDRRQVIPVVATRADGVEERTIVLAVERNTKVMETLVREPQDVGKP